ncbi:hypothetical protein AAGS39_32500 [Flavobacterium sp. CGRL2]
MSPSESVAISFLSNTEDESEESSLEQEVNDRVKAPKRSKNFFIVFLIKFVIGANVIQHKTKTLRDSAFR